MPILLFSCGALRRPEVQLAWFGRLLTGADDALPGHLASPLGVAALNAGEDPGPVVSPSSDPRDEVTGVVFEVSGQDLSKVDQHEAAGCVRRYLRLKSGINAWVYLQSNEKVDPVTATYPSYAR
jgi:hypothetical protein